MAYRSRSDWILARIDLNYRRMILFEIMITQTENTFLDDDVRVKLTFRLFQIPIIKIFGFTTS